MPSVRIFKKKALHDFDRDTRWGPAIGLARPARWERARRLGLAPPLELLCVLEACPSVWHSVRGAY